jgi:hypothetical protein
MLLLLRTVESFVVCWQAVSGRGRVRTANIMHSPKERIDIALNIDKASGQ